MELRPDLWHCADCETAYAVGLPACPFCGSTQRAGSSQPAPEPPADDDEPERM